MEPRARTSRRAKLYESSPIPTFDRSSSPNPLVGNYRTKDDRYITLMMLQSDQFWPEVAGADRARATSSTDERFADGAQPVPRTAVELIETFDETFASRTLAEWKEALSSAVRCVGPDADRRSSCTTTRRSSPTATSRTSRRKPVRRFAMPVNPVQFDETSRRPDGAPEHGQHTEEILLELGLSWERHRPLQEQGDIL